ncbi:hypothetical protein RB593_009120 [Gaeumannomyces tritici]
MSTRNEELGSKVDHQHGLADLTVDPAAEKKLVRKLDLYLAPIMVLFFPMAYLDRSNIGNAAIAGMTGDLELTGDRLNVAVTVFYITYITFEIPAALSLKLAGPRRLIPFFIISWSLVVVGSAFVTNHAGLLATRLLIGAFESALFPFVTLYLSTFYKKEEQARRVSYLFVVAALSGGLGGLLAYSLTNLHGAGGLAGWRWLFLVEGLVSMAVGVAAIFMLPDGFETAWWLTDDDKRLMRVRREQTAVYLGESELFDREEVRLAFRDPKVWPSAACQFGANTCSFGFGTFLPIIIRGFGYPAVTTQLLTVPVYVWASVFYILVSYLSDRVNRRAVFMTPLALVTAAGYAMLVGVPTAATSVLYFATFVATTGIYCVVGLNVTWVSNSQCGLLQARGRHWHPADGRQLGRHHGGANLPPDDIRRPLLRRPRRFASRHLRRVVRLLYHVGRTETDQRQAGGHECRGTRARAGCRKKGRPPSRLSIHLVSWGCCMRRLSKQTSRPACLSQEHVVPRCRHDTLTVP